MASYSSIKLGNIETQSISTGVTIRNNKTVTTGTYNSLLVDKPIIYLDCSGGNIVINGLSGGIAGQTVDLIKKTTTGQVTLAHNNASGTQKIMVDTVSDFQTPVGRYMNRRLTCDGTAWYSST